MIQRMLCITLYIIRVIIYYKKNLLLQPDYDDIEDDYGSNGVVRPAVVVTEDSKKNNKKNDRKNDDPYYCGMRARVPNFVKMAKNSQIRILPAYGTGRPQPAPAQVPAPAYVGYNSSQSQSSHIYASHAPNRRPPIMYHARSFESGLGT